MNERLKELDGLRGIAVILVMAFHIFKRAGNFTHHPTLHFITSLTSFGWVGVDMFFVLSGFLITSILLKTKNESHYFRNFYARRALRIFPLYYVCLFLIVILMPVLDPAFMPDLPRALPYLLLYQQNWLGLVGHIALTPYLGATWSLAIEEQFYLIWPSIVYIAKSGRLVKIGIGVIALSILARLLGFLFWDDIYKTAKFFYGNTFTRFEQLIFGALLATAVIHPTWKERIRTVALPTFLVSFSAFAGLGAFAFPNVIPYLGSNVFTLAAYTLSAFFSAALIAILVTHPESSALRKLFKNKILAFFGKHSYSMYLLHMPVALLLLEPLWDLRIRGWKMYLFYIVATYGVTALGALCTWHLLEKHALNLKRHFEH